MVCIIPLFQNNNCFKNKESERFVKTFVTTRSTRSPVVEAKQIIKYDNMCAI